MNGEYNYNYTTPNTPPKEKTTWTTKRIVALALCCAILGAAIATCGMALGNLIFKDEIRESMIMQGKRDPVIVDITEIDTSKVMTPAEVYALNVNSTVGITTTITTNFWGFQSTSSASGSGFIVSPDGYIVTNYHVVQGSDSITVSLYNGKTYEAKVVGYEQSHDLAVLKIDATDLVPVVLGNSDHMNVGDSVVAIGNPLGELTFSLTSGAISSMDREITVSNNLRMDLIQTDCAINSGNSGGALFNLYGEVIGITNAKYSSSGTGASIDNIGFAIPMNNVKGIILSIIEKGYYARPYVGISVMDVSVEAQGYGAPKGASVQVIEENSPADKGGLQLNDIITEANGTEITCADDIIDFVRDMKIGDELKLKVYRQGKTVELTIMIGEQSQK